MKAPIASRLVIRQIRGSAATQRHPLPAKKTLSQPPPVAPRISRLMRTIRWAGLCCPSAVGALLDDARPCPPGQI